MRGMTRYEAVDLLLKELDRAETVHPVWPKDIIHQTAIVAEEAGECLQAAMNYYYHDGKYSDAEKEAIHTGAMALRYLINQEK